MIRTVRRLRARPGFEPAVESAWRMVAGQISGLPGHLGQDLLLDANDPRSFVVVTEWADESALYRYDGGPVAARFADAVRRLCQASGPDSYRVMHGPEGRGPTIFVDVEITVPAARLEEFTRGYAEVVTRMVGIPGYLREDLLREPGSDVYHIFAEWRSEAEFKSWISNPAHAQEEAGPIAPFLLDFRRRLFYGGAYPETGDNPVEASSPSTLTDVT